MIRGNLDRAEALINAACGYPAECVKQGSRLPSGTFTLRAVSRQRDAEGDGLPVSDELVEALVSSIASTRMPPQDRVELIALVEAVRPLPPRASERAASLVGGR